MSNQRIIVVGIDIYEFGKVFNDPDYMTGSLLSLVKRQYEGRCLGGMFIKEIKTILEMTTADVCDDGPPKHVTANVRLEVIGEHIDADGLVFDSVIENISESFFLCRSASRNCSIVVDSTGYKSLQVGDYCPAIVTKSSYKPGYTSVTATAIPYRPAMVDVVFRLAEPLSAEHAGILKSTLERANTKKANMPEKGVNQFNQIASQFKSPPKITNKVVIADIINNSNKYVGKYLSITKIAKLDPSVEVMDNSDKHLYLQGYEALTMILNNYESHVDFALFLGSQYESKKDQINRLFKIWTSAAVYPAN